MLVIERVNSVIIQGRSVNRRDGDVNVLMERYGCFLFGLTIGRMIQKEQCQDV